jgi:16S rRNA G1207 methylase RsmC
VNGEHYFTAEPTGPPRPRRVEFDVDGERYAVTAGGGVFSADRLDLGTSVLLRKAPRPDADTSGILLDLGCGYGPVAAVLATAAPAAAVYAVDVNARALELARGNAEALNLKITVCRPDEVPDDVRFDQIWSNPPIRIGKAEVHGMLAHWLSRLTPDGVAWLVVARHLGADSLQRWLVERGWAAERYASQKGYRLLRVCRGEPTGPTDPTEQTEQTGPIRD